MIRMKYALSSLYAIIVAAVFSIDTYATSWLSTQPSIMSEHAAVDQRECIYGVNKEIEVIGLNIAGTQQACVVYGSEVDVAYFPFILSRDCNKAAHIHGEDTKFHPLVDNLSGVFLPANDGYVFTGDLQWLDTVRPLMTIEHLGSALQPLRVADDGTVLSYRIDEEKATSWLYDPMDFDRSYDAGSFAVSANGRYIIVAASAYRAGEYMKIDMQTKEVTVLIPQLSSEVLLADSIAQVRAKAISDDGAHALIGPSAIIMQTSGCGAPFTGKSERLGALLNSCDAVDVSGVVSEKIGYQFDTGVERFIDRGSALSFAAFDMPENRIATKVDYVMLYPGEREDVKPKLSYLAMGDSYSSGEGDIDKKADGSSYYLTNSINGTVCHVSPRSYPFLLSDRWHLNKGSMESVACSGARVTIDYLQHYDYLGQHDELVGSYSTRKDELRKEALNGFAPGIMSQIEFIKKYQPKVVTFTGGGNDVGFADIIGYCATPSVKYFVDYDTCAYVKDPQMRANLNRKIDEQYYNIKDFVEQMQSASPTTQIYMIGYPQFIAEEGWSCVNDSPLMNRAERLMVNNSVTRLNNILKRVAQDARIYYVDIEDSLVGGRICEGSDYMTGPVRAIVDNGTLDKDPNMFHPNAAGHVKIAEAIDRSIKNGMNYEILDIPIETNGWRTEKRAVLPNYSGIGSTHTIEMGPGSFGPDGQVMSEVFSERTALGSFHAASDGSLRATITIPTSVGLGYHLLTLTGNDADGEKIQYQQFVYIISDKVGDIDADGIPDEYDNCNFIATWIEKGKDICNVNVGSRKTIDTRRDSHEDSTDLLMASNYNDPNEMRQADGVNGEQEIISNKIERSSRPNEHSHTYLVGIFLMLVSIITIGVAVYAKRKHKI